MFCGFFFADETGKMQMRTQYYKLKKHIPLHFVEIFIVDITLRAMYVRNKTSTNELVKLEMWANAQPDGRPAKYRWRPLFNAAKFD